ncbi:MAG TPA: gluconeogenesis factor YvcK family protein [Coriobacteriia bacterium]
MSNRELRAVAIGGGTGLPKVLRCLLDSGYETTAVVTMADDGGSSGHLRRELGVLPPGDARNCLVAMADDPGSPLAQVFSYRFARGEGLAGHALGNLMIAALADMEGSFPAALDAAGRMLGTRGRVVPSTLDDVVLTAEDVEGAQVTGQARVARSAAPIACVRYASGSVARAYPPAIEAISEADLVVIAPGSLFTSILPNFLFTGITDALAATRGRVVYVCNVANQRGETIGMDAADHVDALVRHGLSDVLDFALLHDSENFPLPVGTDPVGAGPSAIARIATHGVECVVRDLADPGDPRHHDSRKLLLALREVAL